MQAHISISEKKRTLRSLLAPMTLSGCTVGRMKAVDTTTARNVIYYKRACMQPHTGLEAVQHLVSEVPPCHQRYCT